MKGKADMYASSDIMSVGMKCLSDRLGIVEAEMFIASVKSEDFNYTEWRQTQPWIDMPIEQILKEAAENFPQPSFGLEAE